MSSYCIGLLSGTSMDAIDALLADCSGPVPQLIATHRQAIEPDLKTRLVEIVNSGPASRLGEVWSVHQQLGDSFAKAAGILLQTSGIDSGQVRVIGLHGQTVLHQPRARPPYTLQLGNPGIVAEQTGIPVVADFRSMDIAAGGEGAPLAPLLHRALFRSDEEDRLVINLGGIANVTCLARDRDVTGWDTGPANCLLDAWIQRHRQQAFDKNGDWAASGQPDQELLSQLLADPWLATAPPKSTGTDYFNLDWLIGHIGSNTHRPRDIQATLAQFTARSLRESVNRDAGFNPDRILLCGGGVHNQDLVQRIQDQFETIPVQTTAAQGLDPDWVEGLLFAWLGWQRLNQRILDSRAITGARRPLMLGTITNPGSAVV